MIETRPSRLDALDHLSGRIVPTAAAATVVPEPPESVQIEAPKVRHYAAGTSRPRVTWPSEPIRLTRNEIERALVGSFTYNPHADEIIDSILLETRAAWISANQDLLSSWPMRPLSAASCGSLGFTLCRRQDEKAEDY